MNFVVALLIPLSEYQWKGYSRVVDQPQDVCGRANDRRRHRSPKVVDPLAYIIGTNNKRLKN